jgi:putative lysine transport system substrate-binding protein
MKNRARKSVLLAAISLMFVSGCGTNTNSTSSQNDVIIGMECNYAPFNWTATGRSDYTLPIYNDAGKYADGYDIQFAKKLSTSLNKEVRIMKMEWESLIVNLNSKVIDAVIAGMTDTEERRQSISFSDEYYRSELVLITKKEVSQNYGETRISGDTLSTLLKGQLIESQNGTVTDQVIDTFKNNYGARHQTAVDTFAHAANDVHTGAVYAMTAELPVAQSIVNSYDDLGIVYIDQSVLGVDLSSLGVSIGVRKDDTELKDAINSVLKNYTQEERNKDMIAAVARSGQ